MMPGSDDGHLFTKWVTFVYQLEVVIILYYTLYLIICVTRQPPVIVGEWSIIFERAVFRRFSNRSNTISYKPLVG